MLIFFPVHFNIVQIRHLIPACNVILCTYTWEPFVPHLHTPLLVGGNWNSHMMVVQKVLSWQQQSPSCQRSSFGTSCHFLDKILLVTVTLSGLKSKDHWIPWSETEKIMLLYCRLKVYEKKKEKKFWFTVSINGKSTRLYLTRNDFCFFLVQFRVCLIVSGRWISSKMKKIFIFHKRRSPCFQSNVYYHHPTTYVLVFGPWKED